MYDFGNEFLTGTCLSLNKHGRCCIDNLLHQIKELSHWWARADIQEAVKASVLLISGCQDNQLSQDGDFNGLFTAYLLRTWNDGKFKKGYKAFHKAIVNNMPPDQTPNYFWTDVRDKAFEKQRPFTI